MKVGGVQKSLCNLLWELNKLDEYEVTLVLFCPVGAYMQSMPPNVKVVVTDSWFRYFGISQSEASGIDKLKRGFLASICRIFGRSVAVRIMCMTQKPLPETYDYAMAFLHNGRSTAFYGGVQDFVLHCVKADNKFTFLHDDYNLCGANFPQNNHIMDQFKAIAACSEGCRRVFVEAVPELGHKSVTVRNCNNVDEIKALSEEDTVVYDESRVNILCAARFSPRKGIDRAIEAADAMLKKGIPLTLHILGSGIMEDQLKAMVMERGLDEHVIFYGEQSNPYRYMKNADLFLLTSYREAAPMVIDEAYILGVPTLTTRTNSSDEMVTDRACGWVCENDQQSLEQALEIVIGDVDALRKMKAELRTRCVDNSQAVEQFKKMIEG